MKILFFSPHSAIWQHAFPEALVAETLQQEGCEVLCVTCTGQLDEYCICMSAYGLFPNSSTQEKQKICSICRSYRKIIKQEFGVEGFDLGTFLTGKDHKELADIMSRIRRDNFLGLIVDGLHIGKIALYEVILHFKKTNLDFSEDEWGAYRISLKNALTAFFSFRRILDREKPERVVTYNSAYSINRICCQLAEARGIPTYSLHAGLNLSNSLQTMIIAQGTNFKFYDRLKDFWRTCKDKPCSEGSLRLVTDHFMELFKGKHFWAYSSSRKGHSANIRKFFAIAKEKKVLVATMSSYDERMAAETSGLIDSDVDLIFPKQVDWIKALIQFMRSREDLFLIIRVHPREFPNKREGVKSEHSTMLEQELKDLPPNVKINWPTDNISLYDLAEETDVFLNAWSSVGEEMSLLGFPVVIYSSRLVFYASDLNYVATSKVDYFEKIDQALRDGWSFERIRMTYRWYVLKFERSVVNIAESFSPQVDKSNWIYLFGSFLEKINSRILCILSSRHRSSCHLRQQYWDCKNRAKYLKARRRISSLIKEGKRSPLEVPQFLDKDVITLDRETAQLKKEVRRLGVTKVITKLSSL